MIALPAHSNFEISVHRTKPGLDVCRALKITVQLDTRQETNLLR